MPDILPPQLVGVQQRSLYVKARTVLTVISCLWLLMAITGIGFFSGGTTSLAFSLILLYGTGVALIAVIAAIYRFVRKILMRRAEGTSEHTAALAFVDTARSANQEFRAALRPPTATGRQYAPAVRNVGPGVSMPDAVAAARTAAVAESVAQAVAAAQAAAVRPAVQENPERTTPDKKNREQSSPGQNSRGTAASEPKASAAKRPRLVLASSSAPQEVRKVRQAPGCQKAS